MQAKDKANDTFVSANSIGPEQDFETFRNEQIVKEVKSILIDFLIALIIFGVIVAFILIDWRSNPEGCGIPIREWLLVFFLVLLFSTFVDLIKILVVNYSYDSRTTFALFKFVIVWSVLAVWLFIGYGLFNSDSNNCEQVDNTQKYYVFMFIVLIVGFILLVLVLLALCIIPCVYCAIVG
mmetsp:Transcript_34946/g.53647  ORF Transcript_34946/g.53647 Transcript_34946/m.53647 type:complete len:180 (-) Transcript_34946:243-782(-)